MMATTFLGKARSAAKSLTESLLVRETPPRSARGVLALACCYFAFSLLSFLVGFLEGDDLLAENDRFWLD